MKKRLLTFILAGVMGASMLAGCGGSKAESPAPAAEAPKEEAKEEPKEAPKEEPKEEAKEETTEEASESGLTFADLQDNYAVLSDLYQKVEDLYMNDAIAQDSEVEGYLQEAKALIDEMGEATEDQFTSDQDLQDMNDAMVNMIDALGGIVDRMQAADGGASEEEASDVSYVDGFYANDGNGHDFMIAFYEGAAGDVAYVNDGSNEVFAEYTVENAQLDDGTEYLLVTVGATQLGYVENGDDLYIVDADGTLYAAGRLSEEEADELAKIANN